MNTATLVMAYYDNARMLQEHVSHWNKYSADVRSRLEIIVVDDGSREIAAADLIRDEEIIRRMRIRVYRVTPDIPWNQDGARNLGMNHCDTDWALMTDMDHVLYPDQAEAMLAFSPVIGTYYLPRRCVTDGTEIHPHPNTFLFNKCDFWEMGGYDEDFSGHYGSDGNFRKCAQGAGIRESETTAFSLTVYRREEILDANTRRYGRKESDYYAAKDPVLNAKRRGPPYRAERPIRFEWVRML